MTYAWHSSARSHLHGGRDVALVGRLVEATAAQLAALPAGQLPAAAAAALAQAAAAVADVRAGLPAELWELRHWSSEEVVAAAAAKLQQGAEGGGQGQLPDVTAVLHAQLLLLSQAAAQLESVVEQAGPALPQQRGLAAAAEAEQQQAQQLVVVRTLRLLRCAHLGCTNVAGGSEAELPCRLCTGCRQVRYCSAECAALAWRQHRPACKLVRHG